MRNAVDGLMRLAGADFGMPQVTDLGTTTVTVSLQGTGR